ncbi:unnamed protein product [Parascedosporium putredinis]|uniref:Uncharacterized protein n=1 Tax=Parascedosporium putredinis TaxID=1442378 RepID=A0A9P1HAT5_9PEZI|nr:unnamed protein product [Parascedosporium putredinis]CAI8004877.1 unnamed protein product [Parascedosporium putredinis]
MSCLLGGCLLQYAAPAGDGDVAMHIYRFPAACYCDGPQSGYLDNHNISPELVLSDEFGILWKNTYGEKERWFARPLTFTPKGHDQLVLLASTANVVRTVDATTGKLIHYYGIIGTPAIDPKSEIAYFFSMGYQGRANSGGVGKGEPLLGGRFPLEINNSLLTSQTRDLGTYSLYAVDLHTLEDVEGFPVLIDGHYADNDPTRYFLGGTYLQRPAVSIVNGHVIGAFAGHCELFNYTGMVVSVSTTPGVGVASMFAVVARMGGIWHGGMGISTIGNNVFIVSGNGDGADNVDQPAAGDVPISTLSQAVVHFEITKRGKISFSKDIGSSGFTILDRDVFSGGGVGQIGLTGGKEGKLYVLDVDNLGGFMNGPNGRDDAVQIIQAEGALFGGVGSYPLEGGYVYFTPLGSRTAAYKLEPLDDGTPNFALAGYSTKNATSATGIGPPTVTTLRGKRGTGIVWVADLAAGLRAFKAVPNDAGSWRSWLYRKPDP